MWRALALGSLRVLFYSAALNPNDPEFYRLSALFLKKKNFFAIWLSSSQHQGSAEMFTTPKTYN